MSRSIVSQETPRYAGIHQQYLSPGKTTFAYKGLTDLLWHAILLIVAKGTRQNHPPQGRWPNKGHARFFSDHRQRRPNSGKPALCRQTSARRTEHLAEAIDYRRENPNPPRLCRCGGSLSPVGDLLVCNLCGRDIVATRRRR